MLRAFVNAFKVPDLRKKILFTLFIIAIYRFGSYVPVPIIDLDRLTAAFKTPGQGGFLSFIDLFSGGALTRMAVFGLGIMPYITSSIIMQLLTVVIPKLEQWQKQGETGIKKINQWTRYVTVVLALLQSTGLVFLFHSGAQQLNGVDVFRPGTFTAPNIALIVLIFTAGTALIMWMGELITQRGIGNGMSVLIFASVISSLPSQGRAILLQSNAKFVVVLLIGLALVVAVVFVEQGQRRIPVQYAKRVVGRRMYGGQSTYIPLKVNQSGVIPIIFASSVLQFPALIVGTLPWQGVKDWVNANLIQQGSVFYIGAEAILIVFFAYFYTAIAFNPAQQADIIRKQGGFIPGIRPGPPTERYLAQVLNRITFPGSLFLAAIAVVPLIVFAVWDIAQFPFGGTAILITVGVALE
ncbi:MAG: preprotein translocase subunit SecY, partial [Actinomycetota bacterium]